MARLESSVRLVDLRPQLGHNLREARIAERAFDGLAADVACVEGELVGHGGSLLRVDLSQRDLHLGVGSLQAVIEAEISRYFFAT